MEGQGSADRAKEPHPCALGHDPTLPGTSEDVRSRRSEEWKNGLEQRLGGWQRRTGGWRNSRRREKIRGDGEVGGGVGCQGWKQGAGSRRRKWLRWRVWGAVGQEGGEQVAGVGGW